MTNSISAAASEGLSRAVIYRSFLGSVETLDATPYGLPEQGFNQRPVIAHCHHGLFDFWSGQQHATFDGGRVLMLGKEREYRERHPIAGRGHRALLFVPSVEMLEDMPGLKRSFGDALSRSVGGRFAMLSARWRVAGWDSQLAQDELWCATMTELAGLGGGGTSDNVLVNRAKALLNTDLSRPVSLGDVARRLRVTPNHLTHCFTRAVGMPLYRYHLRLRLLRALDCLAHADDLTGLAIDLGFSSHSHFSVAFRRQFGLTPSAYRAETRTVLLAA